MRIILFSSKSTLVDFIRSLSFFILIKSFTPTLSEGRVGKGMLFEKKKNFIKVFLFSLKTLDQLNPFQDYFVTHVSIINSILSNLALTRSSLINRTFFILILFSFFFLPSVYPPKRRVSLLLIQDSFIIPPSSLGGRQSSNYSKSFSYKYYL